MNKATSTRISDLYRKTRQIEIRVRHLVSESFAGRYQATFKGQGIEFSEVRPYQPGDEVRSIDWNVTARMGAPYVKRYVEERELTVLLVIDASGSGDFGTVGRFRRDLATELSAVLSIAATTSNDRVGLLVFTDRVELFVPPRKGRRHVTRVISEMLEFQPRGRGTDVAGALNMAMRVLKRRGVVFLVSDFLADPASYRRPLVATNQRHDVVAIEIHDPMEREIPDVGLLALEDAETGEVTWVDTGDPTWRAGFERSTAELEALRTAVFASAGVDRIRVSVERDYVSAIVKFFLARSRRAARRARRARAA